MKRIVLATLAVILFCLVGCKGRYVKASGDNCWHTANEPTLSETEEMPGEFIIQLFGLHFYSSPSSYDLTLRYSGEDWFGLKVQDLVFRIDGETLVLPIELPDANLSGTQALGTQVTTTIVHDKLVWESMGFDISPYQLDSLRSAGEVSLVIQDHQLRFNKKVFMMFDAFCDRCVDPEFQRLEYDKKEKEKLEERERLMKEKK